MDSIEALLKDGVVIIDKPPGITSHEVTTFVKKITGASRAGHAGTLDPEVSGVLPVALGRATKLLRYIAAKDKTYVGIMKFKSILARSEIEKLFLEFTGELVQTPPKISAVRKVPRKRTVYALKLLEADRRLALFETKVDAGTYIRTLCEDMGKKCGGARMEELRRVAVGKIIEGEAHTMQELIDSVWFWKNKGNRTMLGKMLNAPEKFIEMQRIYVKESVVASMLNGAQLMAPGVEMASESLKKGERVAIYSGEKFVGIGVAQVDAVELHGMKHGLVVKIERLHWSR